MFVYVYFVNWLLFTVDYYTKSAHTYFKQAVYFNSGLLINNILFIFVNDE